MAESKHEAIYRMLKARIDEGFWKGGERILSERQLSESFSVSRLTIKRAISRLIAEGFLTYKEGKRGTFVASTQIPLNQKSGVKLIGVAVDNYTPTFASEILQGIHDAVWERGYQTLYCNTYHENDRIFDKIKSLINPSIRGIILSPLVGGDYNQQNGKILEILEDNKLPVVLVDRFLPDKNHSHVILNNLEITYKLMDKLFTKGHRRILCVSGMDATSSFDRRRGFYESFQRNEIDPSGALELNINELDYHNTRKLPQELIDRAENMGHFTAVIGLNQLTLDASEELLIRMNRTAETACFVSGSFGNYADIAVLQPIYRMGLEAGKLLMKTIEDPDFPTTQLILKAMLSEKF